MFITFTRQPFLQQANISQDGVSSEGDVDKNYKIKCEVLISGIARPGPTRACALPSTFQTLPSAAQHDSRDSIKN